MSKKVKIPKYWSEQYKAFTGLDATEEDYLKHPNLFKPRTLYEENPIFAWIFIIVLTSIVVMGSLIVFK